MKIAFFIHKFPQISEVFIINQVADLLDRGIDVEIFALERGESSMVSDRYIKYKMGARTHIIGTPSSKTKRIIGGIARATALLFRNPFLLVRALDIRAYGSRAYSLKMLYAAYAFAGKQFDVVHCHFGKNANQYLPIRRMLRHKIPMLTSFYGYDISHIPKLKGPSYYDELKKVCHRYIVMSQNMKERVEALGFSSDEIVILPVSIHVDDFTFRERKYEEGRLVEIVSVGRFVEKKGFDDLLRALAIVKEKTSHPVHCTVVGGGEREIPLKKMASELKVDDMVSFPGFMKLQEVESLFLRADLYVQPSKTAKNGDME